jgi:anaerobic C4-dicarboxylate transporter
MLDGQPEAVLAECARQHRRVMRGAVFTGILLAVLLAVTIFATATERYHGPIVVLVPVLFALNGTRLLKYAAGMYKIRNAERLIRKAQPRLPAVATVVIAPLTALLCGERRNHHDHPGRR